MEIKESESSEEQVEDTTEDSQPQSTEQEETSSAGENPTKPEGAETEAQNVPYERFKEVNDQLRELREFKEKVSPILERQPETEQVDPNQFETVEDLINYVKNQNETSWQQREQALEHKFNARLEAQQKLNELKQTYPEEMKDSQFRNFVITSMQNNPQADPLDTAAKVKDYLETVADKGRKAAKEEFIKKGSFQGKFAGNQPHQTKEDKSLVDSIVNAGGPSESIF